MRHVKNQKEILLPLSVEGHVQKLIQEATKPSNLAVMYSGWASYL
jgi:phosphatidylinositol kinase/protein kinase (PI-3  family)